jgi:hypothetical protein
MEETSFNCPCSKTIGEETGLGAETGERFTDKFTEGEKVMSSID